MDWLAQLPRAYSDTGNSALFRQLPEHFQVNEVLNFKPKGEGDHLYLRIQKRDTNTDWLAKELAIKAKIRSFEVGYAGRKDRFAVTSQWFSLHLPNSQAIDINIFEGADYKILEQTRHTHKLRKGEIDSNQFKLQLIDFKGSFESLDERISLIAKQGFPNYFGAQRFGHQGSNVDNARDMLSGKTRIKDRNIRSIYLSAARSYLFNLVLAKRIENTCWRSPISGDHYWDEQQTIITGPMPGDGPNTVTDNALELETEVLQNELSLYQGIANSRVQWHRRPLWVTPGNIRCRENNLGVEIEFSLPTGAFATSLLREIISL